jgi:hypothetical protein
VFTDKVHQDEESSLSKLEGHEETVECNINDHYNSARTYSVFWQDFCILNCIDISGTTSR